MLLYLQNEIRDSIGGNVVAENTKNILSCNFSEWFWISWSPGVSDVYVGKGADVGSNLLMHYKDIVGSHPIENIAFKSSYKSSVWEFSDLPGLC